MTYSHGLNAKVRWENGKVKAELIYWPRCGTRESAVGGRMGGLGFVGGGRRGSQAREEVLDVVDFWKFGSASWDGLFFALSCRINTHTHVADVWGVSGYQIQQTSEVIRGLMIERGKKGAALSSRRYEKSSN